MPSFGGLVLLSLGLAAPARATDVKISDEARKHFNAGVSLLRDPDGARYEDASGEAIAAFERYLSEGKKELDAGERADIERDLSTLRASAATLSITTTVPGAVIVDERVPVQGDPVRNRYQAQGGTLQLQVRPGHHVLTASIPDEPARTWELDVKPGGGTGRELRLAPRVGLNQSGFALEGAF